MENREDLVEVKLRIITEVRQHPVIYDKAHKSHFKKMSKLLFLIVLQSY